MASKLRFRSSAAVLLVSLLLGLSPINNSVCGQLTRPKQGSESQQRKVRFGVPAELAVTVKFSKSDETILVANPLMFYAELDLNRQVLFQTVLPTQVSKLALDPNGSYVATGNYGRHTAIALHNRQSTARHDLFTTDGCAAIDFSDDGTTIAASSGDEVVLWNVNEKKVIQRFVSDNGMVTTLDISRNGEWVIGGCRTSFTIWSIRSPQEVHHIQIDHSYQQETSRNHVALTSDGTFAAIVSNEGQIAIHKLIGNRSVLRANTQGSGANCVEFSPDGRRIAVGTMDGTVDIFDASSGKRIGVLSAAERRSRDESREWPVVSVDYSTDGKVLAVGTWYGGVQLWRLHYKQPELQFEAMIKNDLSGIVERSTENELQ